MEKHIIYVDASCKEGSCKIGLYDKKLKKKHTILMEVSNISSLDGEQYAILYGLIYIKRLNLDSRFVLLNDNELATQNEKLIKLGNQLNTKISWIPREINKADKYTRTKPNKDYWNDIELLYSVMFDKVLKPVNVKKEEPTSDVLIPSDDIDSVISEYFINKEGKQYTKCNFVNLFIKVIEKNNLKYITGSSKRIINKLIKDKIIILKANSIIVC